MKVQYFYNDFLQRKQDGFHMQSRPDVVYSANNISKTCTENQLVTPNMLGLWKVPNINLLQS